MYSVRFCTVLNRLHSGRQEVRRAFSECACFFGGVAPRPPSLGLPDALRCVQRSLKQWEKVASNWRTKLGSSFSKNSVTAIRASTDLGCPFQHAIILCSSVSLDYARTYAPRLAKSDPRRTRFCRSRLPRAPH